MCFVVIDEHQNSDEFSVPDTGSGQGRRLPGACAHAPFPPNAPLESRAGIGASGGTRTSVDAGLEFLTPTAFPSPPCYANSSPLEDAFTGAFSFTFSFRHEQQMSACLSLGISKFALRNRAGHPSSLINRNQRGPRFLPLLRPRLPFPPHARSKPKRQRVDNPGAAGQQVAEDGE